ncbi:nuclear transport factor 2 family protein [Pseudonocardia sp. WMMC193]|uniref:nuclear transport factor 2 family protein n=1 Tax=Pseudonocardia sp. WMMC193 TaxID=2911965 RepID=UPI001F279F17|nr:nuclear transport factor 2 family protein [Pseudonocardia sp. WMMC193]MCF7549487.1 nuclear transport factor 2 family protein [Pseudonocardia sp. WMMC193]
MTGTDLQATISEWVDSINTHDTEQYLAHFTDDAVLDDPSVGGRFEGRAGIAEYYRRYFIEYNTTTRVVSMTPRAEDVHVVVDFTGDFPGGRTGGVFDVKFAGELISFVHADLT